ncbi:MAG TPA: hypothetical protein VIM86_15535 [Thermodesulfobacteriota bacterium]|jgi:hypothetical protein
MRRPKVLLGVAALVLASGAVSFALLGDGGEASSDRFLPGNSRAGAGGALSQVPEAECSQWRRGTPQQRRYVIRELGAYFGRNGSKPLPAEYAEEVLDRACAQEYAAAIKLWKIYERAHGFQYDRSVLDR